MTENDARHLAQEWIDAWNRHDLDAILTHYAASIEFTSPFVAQLVGEASGMIRGRDALRSYFAKGLAAYPDLRFELLHVLTGVESVTLFYRSVNGLLAAEVMTLDALKLIRTARVRYAKE